MAGSRGGGELVARGAIISTFAPTVGPVYYRHSGKVPVAGLVTALCTGLAAGAVLAIAYAYAILYIPIGGWVSFLLTGAFAFALGWVMARAVRYGNVRNLAAATAIAAGVAVVAWYVSWAAWEHALIHRIEPDADVSMYRIAADPVAVWRVAADVNKVGAWSIKRFTPTGTFLWLIWAAEAAAVIGIATVVARKRADSDPFCETCDRWTEPTAGVAHLNPGDPAALKQLVETRDYAGLSAFGPADPAADHRFRVDLHSCPTCRAFNTVTVSAIATTVNNKGERSEQAHVVVPRLVVDQSDADELRGLQQAMLAAQPPPPVDEPAGNQQTT